MTERSYNGWKNWQTWNVALWLNNDESLYRAMQESRRLLGRYSALSARAFVEDVMPNGTPDMATHDGIGRRRGRTLAGVHWPSIARVINESIA